MPPMPTLVATALCGGGSCPTIFRSTTTSALVQGRLVDAASYGIKLGKGEAAVEIPLELLDQLAQARG